MVEGILGIMMLDLTVVAVAVIVVAVVVIVVGVMVEIDEYYYLRRDKTLIKLNIYLQKY